MICTADVAADHGWLAKVLAGDHLACGVLDLLRSLPADEWDVFARCVELVAAGASAAEAGATLQQECGRAPA